MDDRVYYLHGLECVLILYPRLRIYDPKAGVWCSVGRWYVGGDD